MSSIVSGTTRSTIYDLRFMIYDLGKASRLFSIINRKWLSGRRTRRMPRAPESRRPTRTNEDRGDAPIPSRTPASRSRRNRNFPPANRGDRTSLPRTNRSSRRRRIPDKPAHWAARRRRNWGKPLGAFMIYDLRFMICPERTLSTNHQSSIINESPSDSCVLFIHLQVQTHEHVVMGNGLHILHVIFEAQQVAEAEQREHFNRRFLLADEFSFEPLETE